MFLVVIQKVVSIQCGEFLHGWVVVISMQQKSRSPYLEAGDAVLYF